MRLIFAGTPDFAAVALQALLAAGHEVPLVLTQPDRPAGRGMKLHASAVKQLALKHGLEVYQPVNLREPASQVFLSAHAVDVMVVAAYGLILPQAVLNLPRYGCLNIHASLLPRWRGAAPIQRAVLAGDARTGVAIMQMEAGLDTGPVITMRECDINPAVTAGELHDVLATMGADLLLHTLSVFPEGTRYPARPQPTDGVSYAAKIEKEEARIDWQQSATDIMRRINAFNPFPGAYTIRDGQVIKIWRATMTMLQPSQTAPAGTLLDVRRDGIRVACGGGVLNLQQLQAAGGRRLDVADFVAGHPLRAGDRFESPSLEPRSETLI